MRRTAFRPTRGTVSSTRIRRTATKRTEDTGDTKKRVCVGAVLVRASDRRREGPPFVLLGRRGADRAFYPGVWDVIGGHLEPGETPEQALVRELREETGVTPTEWRSLGEVSGPLPGGDGSIVLHLYAVTAWNGTPRNRSPKEHYEISWFAVEDACRLALAHPAYPEVLRRAVRPRLLGAGAEPRMGAEPIDGRNAGHRRD